MSTNSISYRDFSIIFKEIENLYQKDPSIRDNIVDRDVLEQDDTIREFGEICSEISSMENDTAVFMTFS
jgi:hypothetical protein